MISKLVRERNKILPVYSATGNIIGLVDNTKTPNDATDTLSRHTVDKLIVYSPLSPTI